MSWTIYCCPVCKDDRRQGGPWSCSSGHALVDAEPIEVVPVVEVERLRDELDEVRLALSLAEDELQYGERS